MADDYPPLPPLAHAPQVFSTLVPQQWLKVTLRRTPARTPRLHPRAADCRVLWCLCTQNALLQLSLLAVLSVCFSRRSGLPVLVPGCGAGSVGGSGDRGIGGGARGFRGVEGPSAPLCTSAAVSTASTKFDNGGLQ